MLNRAAKSAVFRVLHDHSQIEDEAYFERTCGTLLSVNGSNLIITPGGGESALVIPAREVVEIRLNNFIGKEFGVFHVITRQGLYSSFAPSTSNPDSSRQIVSELRNLLNISEK